MNAEKYHIKIFVIITILSLIALQAKSQTPQTHTPKYIQKENGKIYWNMKLPAYITFATKPGGERHHLQTKDGNTKQEFVFTVEGLNYIKSPWAVDKETRKAVYPKQLVSFPVWVDGTPPITTIEVKSSKKYIVRNEKYYSSPVKIILKSHDKYSGVENSFVSLNGNSFEVYNDTVEIITKGRNTVKYYAVDKVGNASKVKEINFIIDENSPTTQLSVSDSKLAEKNILSAKSKITLKSTDDYSNLKNIYYQINNFKQKIYQKPIPVRGLKTGNYTIKYYAVDKIGNVEETQKYDFYIDKLPPMVSSRIIGDLYQIGDNIFFSGKTKLKLTGFDNKSGVASIKYSIDNKEYKEYNDDIQVSLPTEKGVHTIRYYAIDSIGNAQIEKGKYTYKVEKYYLDLAGPQINYALEGPRLQLDTILYLAPKTKIIIKTEDLESGSAYSAYNYNGNPRELKYTKPIQLGDNLKQGENIIDIFAYDNVKNRNIYSFPFFFDKTPPTINIAFGGKSVGAKSDVKIYPYFTSVQITAYDGDTDIKSISYILNNEKEKPYTGMIQGFEKQKLNTLEVIAVDLLDNKTTKKIQFYTY